ncbi:MAG: error-prone DNA polymerase [Gammaproteobacteria bacterium]|nr:error-prone DNA polymerase [Gammaproteobacteria bacterium]
MSATRLDPDPPYAELHCLSNFSFLNGASHPEELVRQAFALGYTALALSDECSLAGVVRAHVVASELGLKLIIGSRFTLEDGLQLILLAPDAAGYAQLSRLISGARRQCTKGAYRLTREDLTAVADSVLALWVPPLLPQDVDAYWLRQRFGERAWITVGRFYEGDDRARYHRLCRLSQAHQLPLVATGDVHLHAPARRALADVLQAIRLSLPLAATGFALAGNSERYLRPRARLGALYPPALLAESLRIAGLCNFSLTQLRYAYPRELVPEGRSPTEHLRALTVLGAARRWPAGTPPRVLAQLEHELQLIAELEYEAFFLTVYDLVCFARGREILCQGRGSAANSAVCYCLGITEVDPARMEMLFERFISKERGEPPDIDVDFEHDRREEVLQYIYQKYGRQRAALAATVICYRARSAVRDVGRALGLSPEQVTRIASKLYWWDRDADLGERLREAGFDPAQPVLQRLVALVTELIGFPRHLSQHVGGFIISDGPLDELVPIENAAMPERTVIQWDKNDLDALGLLKVDCLALGMLSAIRRTLALVADFRGRSFSLADVPAEDPATYAMIQRADTVGVFQIESRAQMAMLPRLKPACYYDLVIEVAIIRPGPIQGEMVHPYLRRRCGEEAVTYPSPEIRNVLERTLGIPLFQEQVIKLAMVAAGFSPGEADNLRRSMAAWRRNGGLQHLRTRLIEGMCARGYEESFAERICNQIQGFGEYGFPESHAASFALLAYVSAWLKCHEPAAFLAALLNSQPMGFYAPAQLVQDAQRHGVTVRAVDVNASAVACTLEPLHHPQEPGVRIGLALVQGLSVSVAARVVAARAAGIFVDVHDLAHRAELGRRELRVLAEAGALVSLAGHRHRAHWAALGLEAPLPLLPHAGLPEASPLLRRPTEGEEVCADYARLGFTLGRHPLELLRGALAQRRCRTIFEVQQARHGERVDTAGLVILRQRPGTATGVVFVTLEDETGTLNLIVWSSLAQTQRRELLGARLLGVSGKVQREDAVVHLVAEQLSDHTGLLGRLAGASRDFH